MNLIKLSPGSFNNCMVTQNIFLNKNTFFLEISQSECALEYVRGGELCAIGTIVTTISQKLSLPSLMNKILKLSVNCLITRLELT